MTIDEVVQLLQASQPNPLTALQELVLRSAWEGKTYTTMAQEAHYGEERVRKVASILWQLLSEFTGEAINKSTFRAALEPRRLTKAQQQLIAKLNPPAITTLEFPSGPVSLDSSFYIPRPPVEELAYGEIAEPGSIIRIKAPRKMGKSSLMLRLLAHATNLGYRTVTLDFQQADKVIFSSLDRFLRWFCANVSRELHLESKLDAYWDEDLGSKVSCTIYFQDYLLKSLNNPLVLALNEVNLLYEHSDIAQDFLPLLRYWYEQGRQIGTWQKLRVIFAYSTDIHLPLKLNQSPFNIGLPLKLLPFTKQQVQDLAKRHGLDWADGTEPDKLMAMVGGHPYLVRLALYHLVKTEVTLQELLQQAPTERGIYHDHLRQYVLALEEDAELEAAVKQLIATQTSLKLDSSVAYRLDSMGLVQMENERCSFSCELYRQYFQNQLLAREDEKNSRLEQLEKENEKLRYLSSLDELTQLPNRRYFNAYLQIEWKKLASNRQHLSLILCDIDYFKIYNKTYGSAAGDDCLRKIARALRETIQQRRVALSSPSSSTLVADSDSSDLVARYGGEEFAIILPHTDATNALYIAENIREQIKALALPADYPNIGGLPANVLTVSLGVASTIPKLEGDSMSFVRVVEQALFQSKRRGRDRVTLS
jgi:GGDEF domain-containing protein